MKIASALLKGLFNNVLFNIFIYKSFFNKTFFMFDNFQKPQKQPARGAF